MVAIKSFLCDSSRGSTLGLLFVLANVLALSLFFLRAPGTPDTLTFLHWARTLNRSGPLRGYAEIADYPPLGPLLVWLCVQSGHLVGIPSLPSLKAGLVAAELLSAVLAASWTRSGPFVLLLGLCTLPFGPALGYLDGFYLPLLILMLIGLHRDRLILASVALAIACMIKWQPALLVPFVGCYIWHRATSLGQVALCAGIAAGCVSATAVVFGVQPVWHAFGGAVSDSFLSGYAFNLGWIILYFLDLYRVHGAFLLPDASVNITTQAPAVLHSALKLLSIAAYATSWIALAVARRPVSFGDFLRAGIASGLAYFSLNAGVHENHMFIVLVLAICAAQGVLNPVLCTLVVQFALLNPILIYGLGGESLNFSHVVMGVDVTAPLAGLQMILFVVLWCHQTRDLANHISRFLRKDARI